MHIVTAKRVYSNLFRTPALYQYDYGQVLKIEGLELPEVYEVHFSNSQNGSSTTSIGTSSGVIIPDIYLQSGKEVFAWIYLHDENDDGETVYRISIPVKPRASIMDQQPTPVQQDAITQAIAALNAGVTEVESAVDSVDEAVQTALAEAKASGMFDGRDGVDGKDGIDGLNGKDGKDGRDGVDGVNGVDGRDGVDGADGRDGTDGRDGVDGADGRDGTDGQDGFSPVVSVSEITGGHRVEITDVNGTDSFDVMDGAKGEPGSDGQNGTNGQDGHTPIIIASKSNGVTTISVDGTVIATINDGQDGQNGTNGQDGSDGTDGVDGHSPVITASKSNGVTTISVDGTVIATINDGQDGQDGSDGTDGVDGHSPVITASKSNGVTTVSVDGTAIATINDGQDGQPGADGKDGTDGAPGVGVPSGGTQGQMLVKKTGTDYDTEWQNQPSVPVQDVQVNGTSILSQGVANVPVATDSTPGVVMPNSSAGIGINTSTNKLRISSANGGQVRLGTETYKPIVPAHQHESTFFGLAKAAGDTTQSSVVYNGIYTESAKSAIQKMLGIYEAPWELIREDTVTNATAADIDITVDGNGAAFELSDVIFRCETPVQETTAGIGSAGRLNYWFGSNSNDKIVAEHGSVTQEANAAAHILETIIEQKNGMVKTSAMSQVTNGGNSVYRARQIVGDEIQSGIFMPQSPVYFKKVTIPGAYGKIHYKLYGKRKWT